MGRSRKAKVEPDADLVEQPESDVEMVKEEEAEPDPEEAIADTWAADVAEHRRLRGQRPHGLHHRDHKTRK